uniref:TPA: endonucleasereverse transcriptase putative n=1 Tax=Albugo laibachii Nc14 TaxID=890382 RepID=F0X0I1_9STRA|nr:endonucleasereverse transcriptase putative [Albugo laibachii Nc14]|eukprot:CCA27271.1 endonucleasereverse transcriptase putative [Albugo laibachii Nc14]
MGRSAEETEAFYDTLQQTIQRFRQQLFFILGDFNAKIGQRREGETFLGLYSRGYRNANGIRLRDFCADNDLFLSNTAFYKKRARNITTWQGIRGRDPVLNQINYIILRLRFKPLLSISQSWSGTLVDSDHRLTTTHLQLPNVYEILMRISCTQPSALKYDTALLRDPNILDLYEQFITKIIVASALTDLLGWPSVLNRIKAIANTIIRPKLATAQGPDHNEGIAELSREQKRLRVLLTSSKDPVDLLLYRSRRQALLRTIRQKCKDAGRVRVTQHIMDLDKHKYTERMYQIVRRLMPRKWFTIYIRDQDGRVIGNSRETAQVITYFLSAQFHKPHLSDVPVRRYSMTSPITADEITQAFRSLKTNRAPGADQVPAELLKYSPPEVADLLAEAINRHAQNPTPFMCARLNHGVIITVPKPNKPPGSCANLRPITLLNTTRKTISTVLLNRIRAKVDGWLSPNQSGFRVARSTADAIWAHRWNIALTRRCPTNMFILGIDLTKVFDTIDRHNLFLATRLVMYTAVLTASAHHCLKRHLHASIDRARSISVLFIR